MTLVYVKTMEKLQTKCTLSFISPFYANSLLHVSALLRHPQADSHVVRYITAVDGRPIVVRFLVVHTRNLCTCVCVLGRFKNLPEDGPEGPKHVEVN
jgi:hypothetical protein